MMATDARQRIERGFEALAHGISQYKRQTLAVMLLFMAALAAGIPRLEIDTSMEGFLHKNDPVSQRYEAFKDRFGREDLDVAVIRYRVMGNPL